LDISEIRITLRDDNKLKGFASITLDNAFVIRGLKIIEGASGLFIAMPSRKRKDGTFQDIAHPINMATREWMESQVIAAYKVELVKPDGSTEQHYFAVDDYLGSGARSARGFLETLAVRDEQVVARQQRRRLGAHVDEQQAAQLARAVLGADAAAGEAMSRIGLLEQALDRAPHADPQISADLTALKNSLREVQWAMNGDPTVGRRRESTPPSLTGRLRRFTGGWGTLLHEVTGFHREQYDIVAGEFSGILARLRTLIETDLKRGSGRAGTLGTRSTQDGYYREWAKLLKSGQLLHVCPFKEKIKRDIEKLGAEVIKGTHSFK